MRLFGSAASPFVARVRIQILAKSLPIAMVAPPGGIGSVQLRALSPIGRIPVLESNGQMIPESTIIQEYLEDVYPEPGLRGASPSEAARVRLIGRAVDLYLVPALQPLRAARAADQTCDLGGAQRGVEDALGLLEQLIDGGEFAIANRFSLADCALAPFLFYVNRLATGLTGFSLQRWSKLAAWEKAVQRHAAVSRVLSDIVAALDAHRAGS